MLPVHDFAKHVFYAIMHARGFLFSCQVAD
jgi:hypothetical protein